uniref:DED domain-containing protein n=1 Tax=Acanthochromis polyacanthus TaxID=80966 RepID=A0A3Q1GKX7_9TELE
MSSRQFNAVLLDISNRLSADQLVSLKFLVRDVGKRELEKITSGLQLFQILMERGELSAENTEYLSKLLADIQRLDLADKLKCFDSQSGSHFRVICLNLPTVYNTIPAFIGKLKYELNNINKLFSVTSTRLLFYMSPTTSVVIFNLFHCRVILCGFTRWWLPHHLQINPKFACH